MGRVTKVGYLIPHSEPGGGERLILSLVKRLDRSRFKPYVVLPHPGQLTGMLESAGATIANVPFKRDIFRGYPPGFSFRSRTALIQVLKEWKIDLLHLNDSYLTLLGGLAGRAVGIPVVLTAHGNWDAHFLIQDVLNRMLLKRIWPATDLIERALRRRGIVRKSQVRRVYFGVDTQRFKPGSGAQTRQKLGIHPEDVVITRVARFDTVKDYPTFLKAMRTVLAGSDRAKVIIVGDILLPIPSESPVHRDAIRREIQTDPQFKGRVQMLGLREDVADLLRASDILVSASKSESFGFTLLEAMACEIPVVSTSVGGPAEIVIAGETGALVPPGEAPRLAAAVLDLVYDPAKRRAWGIAGRKRVLADFDLTRYVRDMESEYTLLLKGASH